MAHPIGKNYLTGPTPHSLRDITLYRQQYMLYFNGRHITAGAYVTIVIIAIANVCAAAVTGNGCLCHQ